MAFIKISQCLCPVFCIIKSGKIKASRLDQIVTAKALLNDDPLFISLYLKKILITNHYSKSMDI